MHFNKKKEGILIAGMFSLVVAILLGRFGGVFTGLSLVKNLCYLVRLGRQRRMNDKIS